MKNCIVSMHCSLTRKSDRMKNIFLLTPICCFLLLATTFSHADILWVDFEQSMGKTDFYKDRFYAQFLYELPNAHSDWFRFIKDVGSPLKLYKSLQDNYLKKKGPTKRGKARIPKIIHQIWVGDSPMPEHYKPWIKTWQSIPGWRYKLWTDKDVETYPLINKELYYQEKNMAARADILRLEILMREGGLYVDTDFECLRKDAFDILHERFDFYACLHPLDCKALCLNNAIIAAIPNHPIIKACVAALTDQKPTVNHTDIVLRGPGLLTQMTLLHMNKKHNDIVFPASFFYPLGVFEMKQGQYARLHSSEALFNTVKMSVTKAETLALHWWDTSWLAPEAKAPKKVEPLSTVSDEEAEKLFTDIFEHNRWGNTESASGNGSSLEQTKILRKELQKIFVQYNIKSIIDAPCGDFNWMSTMPLNGILYTGVDIVEPLIKKNALLHGKPGIQFIKANVITEVVPQADLIICRDLFIHLPNKDIIQTLRMFKKSKAKYLLASHYTRPKGMTPDIEMGQVRFVNLLMHPFNLPKPLELIDEKSTESYPQLGITLNDKHMALWAFKDIQIY